MLNSYEVKIDNRSISKEQLKTCIRQTPNKKIWFGRFHLWLYNSSKLEKDNNWNEWLRKNGEEPVIWQKSLTATSVEQLVIFLKRKGYYYADVTDTVILKKKKADVIYNIKTNWPYTINRINYSVPDTSVARLILTDTINSLIKTGILLDENILKDENRRMETNLKNRGYFSFAADFIHPEVDTFNLNRKANLVLIVKPYTERTEDDQVIEMPYPTYTIRSLTVNGSLSMQNPEESANMQIETSDTLRYGKLNFIIPPRFPVRESTIRNALFIIPDSLYRISNVNRTFQHLNGLRNFMQITPVFTAVPGQSNLPERELDCMINLLPAMRQAFSVEPEGTYSEGNLGGGLRFLFHHKSLFGHAEFLDIRLRGSVEAVSGEKVAQFRFNTKMEYEAEASLHIPKFLLPFPSNQFTQKYNPQTTFSILYNYQQYPGLFLRTIFSASFGYNWRSSDVASHFVKPLDVKFVQLPGRYLSKDFEARLNRNPFLKYSYQSHMVVSGSYTFVRDMRPLNKDNFFYIRTYFESAGLLLDAVYRMTGQTKQTGKSYVMFHNEFSQFVKGDVDMRYHYTINGNNRIVARIFTGIGWPYGNSKTTAINDDGTSKTVVAMPFEKKYYAGGANSIRGWRLRSLGPGSYRDSVSFTSYPNNTGDIKLEANLEYRYRLVWVIEGALFMDAGNVWDSRKDDDRPGAGFKFTRFYREIALSGGLGLRFDLKYVILRTDLGMKLHDPAGSGRWAFSPKQDNSKQVSWNDFCLSIAIGYPFF